MNLHTFTNTKLKKLVNVYQLDYINDKSPGIGDFIRGCFCFMQFSQLLNLQFDIDVSNHPIAKYVENANHIPGIDYSNIEWNKNVNQDSQGTLIYEGKPKNININFLNETIAWLNTKDCEVFGFFSHAFPIFNKHNQEGINVINSKLTPNSFMRSYIDHTLNELNLSKKGYGVIHIRAGDKYLVNGEPMSIIFINKVIRIIKKIVVPGKRYLINK